MRRTKGELIRKNLSLRIESTRYVTDSDNTCTPSIGCPVAHASVFREQVYRTVLREVSISLRYRCHKYERIDKA